MNNKLVTRPIVKVKPFESIQHPLGILDRQITGQDLIDNPEKYLKLYGSLFKNRTLLEHEANTRFKKTGKNVGSKNRLLTVKSTKTKGDNAKNLPVFPIIMKRSDGIDKKESELDKFEKIVAERKQKAALELERLMAKQREKAEKKESEVNEELENNIESSENTEDTEEKSSESED